MNHNLYQVFVFLVFFGSMYAGKSKITPQEFYTLVTSWHEQQKDKPVRGDRLYKKAKKVIKRHKRVDWGHVSGKKFTSKEQRQNMIDACAFYHNVAKNSQSSLKRLFSFTGLESDFLSLCQLVAAIGVTSTDTSKVQENYVPDYCMSDEKYRDYSLVELYKDDE